MLTVTGWGVDGRYPANFLMPNQETGKSIRNSSLERTTNSMDSIWLPLPPKKTYFLNI